MKPIILPLSDPQADLETVGGKAMSLAKLAGAGLHVPDGFYVTTEAYRRFVDANSLQTGIDEALKAVDTSQPQTLETASRAIREAFHQGRMPAEIATAIAQAYAALEGRTSLITDESRGDVSKQPAVPIAVAVRSSATAEDLPDASFAGQQETYLNIAGTPEVLDAVKHCWASLWTARAIGYRARRNIDTESVALAVVVQILVDAVAAGILFTANPLNGRRDQIVINAAWGLGEAVVGGAVTPDTLILDKTDGHVIECRIADKQTMTVRAPTGTTDRPVAEALRRAPVLTDMQAAGLAHLGAQIEQLYGTPVDIEWAIADGGDAQHFAVLQARPITALPAPAPPTSAVPLQDATPLPEATQMPEIEPPTEWPIPDPKATYYRSSITELLPDPLTPLFATLGRKAIDAGTLQLFAELIGHKLMPKEMFVTINGYAYYGVPITLKFWLRAIVGIPPFLSTLLNGETRWRDEARPRYLATVERWQRPLSEIAAADLLEGAFRIVTEAVNVYTVYQSGVVGLATMSEILFTPFYEKLIRRQDDPPAITFLLGGDSLPIRAEKSLYDIAQWCRKHPALADTLLCTPNDRLVAQLETAPSPEESETPTPCDEEDAGTADIAFAEWQRRFRAHLAHYGHMIYDLDFSRPVPADDPAPLLETLKLYLRDQGTNPHERQQAQISRREAATQAIEGRLKGLRLKWFRKLLSWVQKYGPMREDTLADIGLGYPLLRRMMRELGERLVKAGMLIQADDVYWLTEEEAVAAAAALDRGENLNDATAAILQKKAGWRAAKAVTPPAGLPERSGMTRWLDKIGPTRTQKAGDTLKGVGSSPGRITVPACVIHGPDDFDRMQPGAALVAAITTPAWTPLFAMAAAIVTDIGGPLSHGSIVAREYGIPAVLGTGEATKRIRDGQMITVDGSAGTVVLGDGG